MDRTLPHFLRFTRALALVSGVAVLPGCGGAVDPGTKDCNANGDCTPYDGGRVGTPVAYDGSLGGTVGYPYDGSSTGTPPSDYDGGPTGTPVIDAGITGYYDGGIVAYDGGPVGVPVQVDAGPPQDANADVFTGGGPLAPPDFPA